MTKRDVIKLVLDGKRPPYVPWSYGFTKEAGEKLREHYGAKADFNALFDGHFAGFGSGTGFFTDIGNDRVKDIFGVVWDRSSDKDIGNVEGVVIKEPTMQGYTFPDPRNKMFFENMATGITKNQDKFRVFSIGFSLYERAWTLRGMENLLMDFYEHPEFVHELLHAIADYNIAQVKEALTYDIDAVHFGDDWGQQQGLIMGPKLWREFIYPELKRMYAVAKDAGKYVTIHSCGDVDELFDDLIGIGLDCFNPFQPEVMDTAALMKQYRGRLSFHGGLSTQKILPYGTPDEVRAEVRRLIGLGSDGSYIFAPAHSVEGDVPVENLVAFIEEIKKQNGYSA
ncbi:MAG: uroporphyrinogen-III decarboxylase-like protein [Spirochaetes bacterium]|nr:uroporphyrinogen-III decarboxylase-like protein [Spirochaetota bacterium]